MKKLLIIAMIFFAITATVQAEEITCVTRCEATEYVLWNYLEGYDGETAPILQVEHDIGWWAEFNEIMSYLIELKLQGIDLQTQ